MLTPFNRGVNGSTKLFSVLQIHPNLPLVQTHNSRLSLSTYGETNRDRGQKAQTNYYTYSARVPAQYGRSCENKRTDFKLTERPKSSKQCRFGAGGQKSLARVVIANISLATNHRCRTPPQSMHIKLQNSPTMHIKLLKKLSAWLPQCNPAIFEALKCELTVKYV